MHHKKNANDDWSVMEENKILTFGSINSYVRIAMLGTDFANSLGKRVIHLELLHCTLTSKQT